MDGGAEDVVDGRDGAEVEVAVVVDWVEAVEVSGMTAGVEESKAAILDGGVEEEQGMNGGVEEVVVIGTGSGVDSVGLEVGSFFSTLIH